MLNDYQMQTTLYGILIKKRAQMRSFCFGKCKLQTANCKLKNANCKFENANCKLENEIQSQNCILNKC